MAGPRVTQWFTAAAVGCASGTGTCTANPGVPLATGPAQWWLTPRSPAGEGPFGTLTFTVPTDPNPPGAPTLIAPAGAIATRSPAYTWQPGAGATWYLSGRSPPGTRTASAPSPP